MKDYSFSAVMLFVMLSKVLVKTERQKQDLGMQLTSSFKWVISMAILKGQCHLFLVSL